MSKNEKIQMAGRMGRFLGEIYHVGITYVDSTLITGMYESVT